MVTYRTTRPGTLCSATSDAAVNCHALSPVSNQSLVKLAAMVRGGSMKPRSVDTHPITFSDEPI